MHRCCPAPRWNLCRLQCYGEKKTCVADVCKLAISIALGPPPHPGGGPGGQASPPFTAAAILAPDLGRQERAEVLSAPSDHAVPFLPRDPVQ